MATFTMQYGSGGSVTYTSLKTWNQDVQGNGVVPGSQGQGANALAVVAYDNVSTLAVSPGDWWESGYLCQFPIGQNGATSCDSSGRLLLSVPANAGGTARTDGVFLQLDTTNWLVSIIYVTGSSGIGPACSRTGQYLQQYLAVVTVPAYGAAVTQSAIADQRLGIPGSQAGIVSGFSPPVAHAAGHVGVGLDTWATPAWPVGQPVARTGVNGTQGQIGYTDVSTSNYTVPAGALLMITSITAGNGLGLQVYPPNLLVTAGTGPPVVFYNGSGTTAMVQLETPMFVASGGTVWRSAAGTPCGFTGTLVFDRGLITQLTLTLTNNLINYTVPAGKTAVLTHLFDFMAASVNSATQLLIDGQPWNPDGFTGDLGSTLLGSQPLQNALGADGRFRQALRVPIVLAAGRTLSIATAATWFTLCGYLYSGT